MRTFVRAPIAACRVGSRCTALATNQNVPTWAAVSMSSRESPTAMTSCARKAADAHVARDRVGLRRPARDEVVGAHLVERDEVGRAAVHAAVVDEPQRAVAVLGEQRVDLVRRRRGRERGARPRGRDARVVVLQAARVVLEQQRGRARRLDLVVDRAGARRRGMSRRSARSPRRRARGRSRPRRCRRAGRTAARSRRRCASRRPDMSTTSAPARSQACSARTPCSVNFLSASRSNAPPGPSRVLSRST